MKSHVFGAKNAKLTEKITFPEDVEITKVEYQHNTHTAAVVKFFNDKNEVICQLGSGEEKIKRSIELAPGEFVIGAKTGKGEKSFPGYLELMIMKTSDDKPNPSQILDQVDDFKDKTMTEEEIARLNYEQE